MPAKSTRPRGVKVGARGPAACPDAPPRRLRASCQSFSRFGFGWALLNESGTEREPAARDARNGGKLQPRLQDEGRLLARGVLVEVDAVERVVGLDRHAALEALGHDARGQRAVVGQVVEPLLAERLAHGRVERPLHAGRGLELRVQLGHVGALEHVLRVDARGGGLGVGEAPPAGAHARVLDVEPGRGATRLRPAVDVHPLRDADLVLDRRPRDHEEHVAHALDRHRVVRHEREHAGGGGLP